ncbi:MAG: hypothetical protein CBC25_07050 [Pelagibacteraceae bacterium TMED65]|nr:MAG: hypothetical protein CBC25_07050 [Pelagibacteraceae bacterium TMED65]|tara:strand:+ start:1331 stop:2134 length:804 start_codon:yes stop_codon:yes gene_type:complete
MSKRKNSLSQNFVKHGYIISDIESVKDFTKIENEVFKTIKNHLKIKKNLKRDYLFNNLHSFLNIKELNKLRLKIYRSLNSKGWFKEAYFSLASQTINNIVGNELAIQNNINFSIQMPKDETSKLELHADSLSGESKFQVVLWVPLVNAYKTKSMYVFDKKFSKQTLQNLKKYKHKGMSAVYNDNKNKKKFLKIKKGQFLLFSPNLLHGNVKNLTQETRISMNARFKNFFSTYGEKSLFGKRLGYFYIPFKLSPVTKFAVQFEVPNEF